MEKIIVGLIVVIAVIALINCARSAFNKGACPGCSCGDKTKTPPRRSR